MASLTSGSMEESPISENNQLTSVNTKNINNIYEKDRFTDGAWKLYMQHKDKIVIKIVPTGKTKENKILVKDVLQVIKISEKSPSKVRNVQSKIKMSKRHDRIFLISFLV